MKLYTIYIMYGVRQRYAMKREVADQRVGEFPQSMSDFKPGGRYLHIKAFAFLAMAALPLLR